MLRERVKMIDVVIEIEALPGLMAKEAKDVLRRLLDSKEISAYKPFLREHHEYQCSHCMAIGENKAEFFDADNLPCCCDRALKEEINKNEALKQIFTDPENQPNQYGLGICPCGNIYEQSNPLLFTNRMCESCLDAESVGKPFAVPVV